jgi:hypothetical protein
MKIYVTAVEALRKKIRQAETPFITKIGGKTTLGPSYFHHLPFILHGALVGAGSLCLFLPPNCETLQITLLSIILNCYWFKCRVKTLGSGLYPRIRAL